MPQDEVLVRIGFEDDATEGEVDRHTRGLVRLLRRLEVDDVRMAEGEAVPGTRSADLATIAGTVLVTGAILKPVLTGLVTLASAWLEQSGQRSVTLEVDGNSATIQGRVDPADVEAYVRALRSTGDRSTEDTGRAETGEPGE